jgi:hypothetical protein
LHVKHLPSAFPSIVYNISREIMVYSSEKNPLPWTIPSITMFELSALFVIYIYVTVLTVNKKEYSLF